jgi:hypothetical protein
MGTNVVNVTRNFLEEPDLEFRDVDEETLTRLATD